MNIIKKINEKFQDLELEDELEAVPGPTPDHVLLIDSQERTLYKGIDSDTSAILALDFEDFEDKRETFEGVFQAIQTWQVID